MPKTKLQKFVFALLTVMITVPLFVWYNMSLEMGGMSNKIFISSIKVIPIEFIFALLLSVFVASPLAMKLAFSIVNPREEKPYIVTLAIICSTVVFMCPMMSLVSAILFHGITVELIAQWMQNIVINFPFAFFSQIFLAQPIVRFIFRAIYNGKEDRKEKYQVRESM